MKRADKYTAPELRARIKEKIRAARLDDGRPQVAVPGQGVRNPATATRATKTRTRNVWSSEPSKSGSRGGSGEGSQ